MGIIITIKQKDNNNTHCSPFVTSTSKESRGSDGWMDE